MVEVEEELGEGDRVLSEPVRDLVRVLGLAVQHRPDLRRKDGAMTNVRMKKCRQSNEMKEIVAKKPTTHYRVFFIGRLCHLIPNDRKEPTKS